MGPFSENLTGGEARNIVFGVRSMRQGDSRRPVTSYSFTDYYFVALGVLLAGYAIGQNLFAYISFPPVYIGDVVLAFGIIAFLKSRCVAATLVTPPSLMLMLLGGWAIFVCALPYIHEFGIDIFRDSVIVAYGAFAFIVVALLCERPERLQLIIPFFRVIGSIVVVLAPIVIGLLSISGMEYVIASGYIKTGAIGVDLTAAAIMMLLGFMRPSRALIILLVIGISLIAARSRGSMLAIGIPIIIAIICSGRWRQGSVIVVAAVGLLGLAYVLDLSVSTEQTHGGRNYSAQQLVNNFSSIFTTEENGLEGTKSWRQEWWNTIFNYTFNGPYFWTGRGFGINLSEADNFVVGDDPTKPLRSPHSCHLNILARTGVPGLVLWFLTLSTWSAMLLMNMLRARSDGEKVWADFFLLIFCYAISFVIDGSFDVSLEGPVNGVWFWCLFGVGIGATMIYRAVVDRAQVGLANGCPVVGST
jgi:O-Antigen ligase